MPENLPEALIARRLVIKELCDELTQIQNDADLEPNQRRNKIKELSKQKAVYGLHQPREFGGEEAGPLETVVVYEELSKHNLVHLNGLIGPQPGLLSGVGEPLRSQYLKPMLAGEIHGAFAFTEPDDAKRPTSATLSEDQITINGKKAYVTGGDTAAYVNTLVEIEPHGPAMVLVPTRSDGLTISSSFQSTDGSSHTSMLFSNVKVPTNHIVGEIGRGIPRAMTQIGDIRLIIAAQSVGLMQWVIHKTAEHLQKPHRSGEPLGNKEGVRLRYADMRIKAYAARSMLYRTAQLAEDGENVINEVVATKVFATEAVGEIVDAAIQLHGGMAIQTGHPLEVLNRRVRAWRFTEGASDVLRLNLVKGDLDLGKGRI